MARSRDCLVGALLVLGAVAGCGSKSSPPPKGDGGPSDSSAGGVSGGAGAGGASADAAACDHAFDNPACWSSQDLQGFTSNTTAITGAGFDGRYLYLVNSARAPSLRHDTQAAALSSGWTLSDAPWRLQGGFFDGAAFDGRYVYFVPAGGSITRYDTQAAFEMTASWTTFGLNAVAVAPGTDAGAVGPSFFGAAFDGRYLYLVPSHDVLGTVNSVVLRYDTQAGFTTAASWSRFDVATVDPQAGDYAGTTFDGRYIYFVPGRTGRVLRVDTQGTFAEAAAWSTFDAATASTPASRFSGAAFDGRYVYFVPQTGDGILTRYDSQAAFGSATSWEMLAASMLGSTSFSPWNYTGATFDGRYVYFVPREGSVLRYDTQASFVAPSSWQPLNLHDVGLIPGNYRGAIFDGRAVYLIPGGLVPVLRFDARATAALPPHYNASFY
jgi:hypothetical protein